MKAIKARLDIDGKAEPLSHLIGFIVIKQDCHVVLGEGFFADPDTLIEYRNENQTIELAPQESKITDHNDYNQWSKDK